MNFMKPAGVAVIAAAATIYPVSAGGGLGQVGCSVQAKSVVKSCKADNLADYWLATGKCQNLADLNAGRECARVAFAEQQEGAEECVEQFEARRELCDQLGEAPYTPQIDPANFVHYIDNRFLPYTPGTTWVYEGDTDDGRERIVVEVTHDTREVLGVSCIVVRDREYLEGELIEDTLDYFAQDLMGNVWYFGELSYEVEDGVIVNLEGSWQAGVDGASPGIVMPANPMVGDVYRQEFLLGEAEDVGAILSLSASVTVPFGTFTGCRETADTTPIEPDALEHKYYAPGVGLVLEFKPEDGTRIELISMTP